MEEKPIATYHGGGTGDTDGRAGDAKYGEPPAYKGQLLRILLGVKGDFVGACSIGGGRRLGGGWWWWWRVMVFVLRMVVPKVERRVRVPEKHQSESLL